MDLLKGLAILAAALIPISSFSDSFDGKLSEAARIQYETALPYANILKNFDSDSFNKKIRCQIEFSSISEANPEGTYAKLLSKSANQVVSFKGSRPDLPLFVKDVK